MSLKRFVEEGKGKEGIRKRCQEFIESGDCIKRIMKGRCQLKTKLMMVKFIEKLRSNLLGNDIVKWKDNIKWREKGIS